MKNNKHEGHVIDQITIKCGPFLEHDTKYIGLTVTQLRDRFWLWIPKDAPVVFSRDDGQTFILADEDHALQAGDFIEFGYRNRKSSSS